MNVTALGVAGGDEAFEVLEGGQVDGGVREHPDKAHGKTAVE